MRLHMLTDPKTLFNVITKSSNAKEKRLKIDIHSVGKVHDLERISNIGLRKSGNNPANAFTMVRPCSTVNQIINQNCFASQIEQLYYRSIVIFKDSKKGRG